MDARDKKNCGKQHTEAEGSWGGPLLQQLQVEIADPP